MTCNHLREYLFAFLDNELDAALSIEVQRHLEHCPSCAREAEIERVIRRQLEQHMQADGGEAARHRELLERVIAKEPVSVRLRPMRRRLFLITGMAATLVFAFAAWRLYRQVAVPRTGGTFADLLVADFDHFIEKGMPLEIESGNAEVVAAWLSGRTGLPVELSHPPAEEGRLLGGRKCSIAGNPAAFAVYELHGVPASVVILSGTEADLERMGQVRHEGRTHWVDRCGGKTIVACPRDGVIHAAVSTLDDDKLLTLMPGDGRAP